MTSRYIVALRNLNLLHGLASLVVFCSLFFGSSTWSQLDTVHYFPPVHSRLNSNLAEQYVYLSTPVVTPFTVTLVDGNGNFIGSAVISKDNPTSIFVGSGQFPGTDIAVPLDSCATVLHASGFIASAPYEFYCNVRIKASFHATSIACKGRAALGKRFYTGSMPQIVSNTNRNFITSIMATENGTVVSVSSYDPGVVFESPLGGIFADALTILLNAGDTYVLTGYTTTSLTNMTGFIGAKILSNKNIAVNTGNYLGSIAGDGSQDAGMVQIVPTDLLGTEHVVVEGGGGPVLERPLIVATANATLVYLNDILTPITILNEGDYYLVPESYYSGSLHKNMVVKTSKPAYVFQCTAATTNSATSEFNFIPPLECYLTDFIDAIPDIDRIGPTVFDGILYVITVAGATITVNGATPAAAAGPEPAIGLPGWETYKMTMAGDVSVQSTGAMAAGFIAVNGFAGAGAYYAGFSFDFQVDGGPDLELCLGEEALLYGDGAGIGGVYDWTGGVLDSVAFVPGASATYVVVGSDIEGCEDEDTVKITVYDLPVSLAGPDQELCDTNATTMAGNVPVEDSGSGIWTFISGPSLPTIENDTAHATEITDLVEGVYEFVWEVSNGTCPSVTDTVTISVYNLPISVAGPDQNLCDAYTTALNGNVPPGTATGLWTMLSGPAVPTFSDNTNANTLFTDLIEGTYTLLWTVSNGSCADSVDTVLINVFNLPVSNAGTDQDLCATYDALLDGNVPLGTATGLWTMYTGPAAVTFSAATDPLATVSGLEEGTYALLWTVGNGTCPVETDTVLIHVYDMPISNAGPDQSVCELSGVTLAGNAPTGSSTGYWSMISGPSLVLFDDNTSPISDASGMTNGDYVLVWTVSNGTCPSVADTVLINVRPYPIIDISANRFIGCAPLGVAFLNLSSPIGDDCLWEFGDGAIETSCGDVYHAYGPGIFDVTLTVTSDGCSSTVTFHDYITSIELPVADFGTFPGVINITNTTVDFTNYSTNATGYTWNFGDGTSLSSEFEPVHTYPETIGGLYEVMLIAENEFGCSDTAYGSIAYEDLLIFYIPNAFTPDGTTINDTFNPVFTSRIDPDNFNMKIFNRWGEILFETYNLNEGWDGTYGGILVEDGVYIWSIEFKDTITDKKMDYRGHVTILK